VSGAQVIYIGDGKDIGKVKRGKGRIATNGRGLQGGDRISWN